MSRGAPHMLAEPRWHSIAPSATAPGDVDNPLLPAVEPPDGQPKRMDGMQLHVPLAYWHLRVCNADERTAMSHCVAAMQVAGPKHNWHTAPHLASAYRPGNDLF